MPLRDYHCNGCGLDYKGNAEDDHLCGKAAVERMRMRQVCAEDEGRLHLIATASEMIRVLQEVEWGTESLCPSCVAPYDEHKPDCALDAVLKKAGVR